MILLAGRISNDSLVAHGGRIKRVKAAALGKVVSIINTAAEAKKRD